MKSFHQRVELRNDIQHSSHFIIYIREQERLLVFQNTRDNLRIYIYL